MFLSASMKNCASNYLPQNNVSGVPNIITLQELNAKCPLLYYLIVIGKLYLWKHRPVTSGICNSTFALSKQTRGLASKETVVLRGREVKHKNLDLSTEVDKVNWPRSRD